MTVLEAALSVIWATGLGPIGFALVAVVAGILLHAYWTTRTTLIPSILQVVAADGIDGKPGSIAVVTLQVKNVGWQPSIADNWNLTVRVPPGKPVRGQRTILRDHTLVIGSSEGNRSITPDSLIYVRSLNEIRKKTGRVRGYAIFSFAGITKERLALPTTEYTIECKDSYGNAHSHTRPYGDISTGIDIYYPGLDESDSFAANP